MIEKTNPVSGDGAHARAEQLECPHARIAVDWRRPVAGPLHAWVARCTDCGFEGVAAPSDFLLGNGTHRLDPTDRTIARAIGPDDRIAALAAELARLAALQEDEGPDE